MFDPYKPEADDMDAVLRRVLTETRHIALVGASTDPARPSFGVLRFLVSAGYTVYPVNPAYAGQSVAGLTIRPALSDCPPVDMVDIFRRSEAVPEAVEEAMRLWPALRTIWMQIGVRHAAAAEAARARGIVVVENRCPKIEHARLMGR